jgi:hypothetical protein
MRLTALFLYGSSADVAKTTSSAVVAVNGMKPTASIVVVAAFEVRAA